MRLETVSRVGGFECVVSAKSKQPVFICALTLEVAFGTQSMPEEDGKQHWGRIKI